MCELFCLSSRKPTRASFSVRKFAAHGAAPTGNVDGWGVAFHEGHEVRLYKEPEPANDSPWLAFIEKRTLPAHLLVSHIRRAHFGPSYDCEALHCALDELTIMVTPGAARNRMGERGSRWWA